MLLKVLVTQSGSSRSWVNPTFLSCREQRFTQAPLRTSRKPGGPDWEAAGKGALPQVPAPSALVGGGGVFASQQISCLLSFGFHCLLTYDLGTLFCKPGQFLHISQTDAIKQEPEGWGAVSRQATPLPTPGTR